VWRKNQTVDSHCNHSGFNAAIKQSVREAFVYGFRIVMSICASLSLASAAVASLMIPQKLERHLPEPSS